MRHDSNYMFIQTDRCISIYRPTDVPHPVSVGRESINEA